MSKKQPIDGEWEAWDRKWPDIRRGPHRMLFTRTEPVTPQQRRLQAYWQLLCIDVGPHPRWSCIELGSGRGTVSQYLAEHGCPVTLVDLSKVSLEIAQQNFRDCGLPRPTVVVADCQKTKLPKERFDLAHSIGLLEHFEDCSAVLKESLRLLRRGGRMWHVIVGGERPGSNMLRTSYGPEHYETLAKKSGWVETDCRQTVFDGVLILRGRKCKA